MTDYQGNILIKNPATPTGPFETGSAPGIWRLQEAMAFKRLDIWPTQGIKANDPYYKFVSLLLSTTSLGNANNNLFVDSSGAFNPISRNGNTTQGSMTPYGANWSNYFDGSGDYLSTSSASFAFGTGAWTVEFWIYPIAYGGSVAGAQIFGTVNGATSGYSIQLGQDINSFRITSNASGSWADNLSVGTGNGPSLNTWTHMAVVRSGANVSIYKNGIRVATTASAGSWNFSGTTAIIGRFNDGTWTRDLNGYLSNLRVANSALYDPTQASITVSTSPLTAASGTILLTCQGNRFRDASSSNLTISSTGETRVTDFSPFSPGIPGIVYNQSDITNWSGYFDGSGDYLTAPSNTAFNLSTGDFTVEFFVYKTVDKTCTWISGNEHDWRIEGNANGTMYYVAQGVGLINPATVLALNTWHHIAVVKSGSTTTVYINGVASGTTTTSPTNANSVVYIGINPVNSGWAFQGYMSNARIVKGTAVYTGNFTPPTTNLTAISGTSLLTLQNAAFTDNSTNNFVITPNGNVAVTGNSPLNPVGYWSNYFDGTSDSLTYTGGSSLNFGTSDFTIELWAFLTNTGTFSPFIRPDDNGSFPEFGYDFSAGQLKFDARNAPIVAVTTTMPTNQWVHVAASRSGTSLRLFVNGTQVGSTTTNSTNFGSTTGTIRIGGSSFSASHTVNGYLSNFRVIKGTSLYTANFTPPTTPLTAITNTSLLTCQNGRFIDNSTNAFTITVNGNTSVQSFDPFYTATIASNGGSMYFDGSDWLAVPDNASLDFGTGDFTIEAWVYLPSALSSTVVIMAGWTAGEPVSGWSLAIETGQFVFSTAVSASYVTATNSAARTPGVWHHVAAVRSSGVVTLYVNGVGGSGVSNTQSVNTGPTGMEIARSPYTANRAYFTGYIATPRITKAALYTGNFTPPTTPYGSSNNTTLLVNGMNAGIYDATAINDMETVSNVYASTAVSKFGGSSIRFNGADYLKLPSNAELAFGTGDFTIEAWVYVTSLSGDWFIVSSIGSGGLFFGQRGGSGWGYGRNAVAWDYNSGTNPVANTWQHIAISRSGTNMRMFVDGVQIGTTQSSSTDYSLATGGTSVGSQGASYYFAGYMDDLRITKGYARYTANFTPPDKAFTVY